MKYANELTAGWGNHPKKQSRVFRPQSLSELKDAITGNKHILAFGNRKSYGDSSLCENSIDMRSLNRIISFDGKEGTIEAEAGLLISDLLKAIVPRGFFVKVTPGTKYITLGGAISSNVHGKNHHALGSFDKSLISFTIMLASGEMVEVSREKNSDLFYSAIAGYGLLGVIYSAKISLRSIKSRKINAVTYKEKNIDSLFEKTSSSDKDYEYTVSWIDTFTRGKSFGRGVITAGNFSEKEFLKGKEKKAIPIPIYFPSFLVNYITLGLFNKLYYAINSKGKKTTDYDKFFYPLDGILNWNKVYGRKGFIQYQFSVSEENALKSIIEVLKQMQKMRMPSFLTVLKKYSEDDNNILLNFPKKGFTLALDFQMTKKTPILIQSLNRIIEKYDGRLYLTKESYMTKDFFEKTYGKERIEKWKEIKKKYDPDNKFTSLQAQRLGLS